VGENDHWAMHTNQRILTIISPFTLEFDFNPEKGIHASFPALVKSYVEAMCTIGDFKSVCQAALDGWPLAHLSLFMNEFLCYVIIK